MTKIRIKCAEIKWKKPHSPYRSLSPPVAHGACKPRHTKLAGRSGGACQGGREPPPFLLCVTMTPRFSSRCVCVNQHVESEPARWVLSLTPEHLTYWEPLAPATTPLRAQGSAPRATSSPHGKRRGGAATQTRNPSNVGCVNVRVYSDMELPTDMAFLLHEQEASCLRGSGVSTPPRLDDCFYKVMGRGHRDRTLRSPAAQGDRPPSARCPGVGGRARSAWQQGREGVFSGECLPTSSHWSPGL